MTNYRFITISSVVALAITLCGCRVDTSTESVPEAEGSGKKAINIRVEPMSREEIKDATNRAIDTTADIASRTRDAATTAVDNAERFGKTITTLTDTMINVNRPGEEDERVTTTTSVTTETE